MTGLSEPMDAGDGTHPMEFLLDEELNLPAAGDIRQGWVVKHRNNEILIDIGAKSEGIIPNREVDGLDQAAREYLAVGNEVSIYVVDPEDPDGNIVVSYVMAAQEKDWVRAKALLQSQEIIEGPVIGFNKGGALVKLGQLRGFVPNSQLDLDHFPGRRVVSEQLRKLIGKKIGVKVIEVDRDRNRLILSERAAGRELRDQRRSELLETIQEGDVFDGRVVNLTDYGAFVDIGEIEGLVHLSELSWKRIKSPAEMLQVGDEIQVKVINVDKDQQRIALSVKRLEADPWTAIDKMYTEGQLIEATITKLTKFGAFARLSDEFELEGLIHISEMSEEHVAHPREVVQPGDTVTVRVIRVDVEQRQLGLSLKQVASAKYLESDMAMLSTN